MLIWTIFLSQKSYGGKSQTNQNLPLTFWENMYGSNFFLYEGEYIEFLLTALNSSVSEWLFSKTGTTTGVGTIRWKKYTIEQLIVAKPTTEQQKMHLAAFNALKTGKMTIRDFKNFSNNLMYDMYD